jgi:protein arginine kinase
MRIVDAFEGDGTSGGEWLSQRGAHSDIVISSRVRLARNVRRHRFAVKAESEERAEIEQELRYALGRVQFDEDMVYVDLGAASPLDAELLVERHLVSRELARGEGPRAACYAPSETVCVMVCEEDHLRLQVLRSGFELDDAWALADEIDDRIARRVDYAFSSRYGYLTCCPTNVGTGLRASVMLHLPALVYSKHIEKVFQAGSKMNLAVRGLYGEGTQALGDFYQISNQVALGLSEADVLERLNRVVPQFIDYERRLRDALLKGDRARLEDRVWRAYGVLRAARTITSDETLELLSAIRLGVNLGMLPGELTIETVNELFITSQPAHLQNLSQGTMEPRERDVARAELLRRRLGPL